MLIKTIFDVANGGSYRFFIDPCLTRGVNKSVSIFGLLSSAECTEVYFPWESTYIRKQVDCVFSSTKCRIRSHQWPNPMRNKHIGMSVNVQIKLVFHYVYFNLFHLNLVSGTRLTHSISAPLDRELSIKLRCKPQYTRSSFTLTFD